MGWKRKQNKKIRMTFNLFCCPEKYKYKKIYV